MPLRFFIDANVLFRAADSPKGGAGELLRLAALNDVALYTSIYVFQEARDSLIKKGRAKGLPALQKIEDLELFTLIETTSDEREKASHTVTDPDDVEIVAAAKKSQASALVTEDRKHLHKQAVSDYIGAPVLLIGEALAMI